MWLGGSGEERRRSPQSELMLDLDVIWRNFPFLMLQGSWASATSWAAPSVSPSVHHPGVSPRIFIGIARAGPQWWIRMPPPCTWSSPCVPLVMVIF